MSGPAAALLDGGRRLHLHHGPIDLIIGADPAMPGQRRVAFAAATQRFETALTELTGELALLRAPLTPVSDMPEGTIARRMHTAARPHAAGAFVTPMAAVAGAVADEVLATMTAATALTRAYVNNGGDIALHLAPGHSFTAGMSAVNGDTLGTLTLPAGAGIAGIATSGQGGRSLSFGIAESITVLGATAADADVAATLIANAVTLPDHPAIRYRPASERHPDSDLGDRLVVTHVGPLDTNDVARALDRGLATARTMQNAGHIKGAALLLRGQTRTLGPIPMAPTAPSRKVEHA